MMARTASPVVAGVDGWRGRWVAAWLRGGALETMRVYDTLHALTLDRLWQSMAIAALDVPIGLPTGAERREADVLARAFVGGARAPSVFFAPQLELLEALDAAAAREIAVRYGWRGASAQVRALRAAIGQAAAVAAQDARVHEVHPEVSFRAMNGAPLRWTKRSWNGFHERRALLTAHGIDIAENLEGRAASVGLDDILDACAAAWSADRIARGDAQRLPAGAARAPAIHY